MNLKEYREHHKDIKCPIGDKLIKRLTFRISFGMTNAKKPFPDSIYVPDEIVRVCGDIPNTIPIELYAKDPHAGALAASDAFIRCVERFKIPLNIEELIYKKFRQYEGYTTTEQKPLSACLLDSAVKDGAPSIGGMLCSICNHVQLLANPLSYDFGLEIESIEDLANGLATKFGVYDTRGYKDNIIITWGMTEKALNQYRFDKVEPYWDPIEKRHRTKDETEEFLKNREAEYKRRYPGYIDKYGLSIPQEYDWNKFGESVPADSLDEHHNTIYMFDANGNKVWLQPEKREYSEQKHAKLEKELADYKQKFEAIENSDYPERMRFKDINSCLDRLQRCIDNNEDITEELKRLSELYDINELITIIREVNNEDLKQLEAHYREPDNEELRQMSAEIEARNCEILNRNEEDEDFEKDNDDITQ